LVRVHPVETAKQKERCFFLPDAAANTAAAFAARALSTILRIPTEAEISQNSALQSFLLMKSMVLQLMNLDVPKFQIPINSAVVHLDAGDEAVRGRYTTFLTAFDAYSIEHCNQRCLWPCRITAADLLAIHAGTGAVTLGATVAQAVIANWAALQNGAGAKWQEKAVHDADMFNSFPKYLNDHP